MRRTTLLSFALLLLALAAAALAAVPAVPTASAPNLPAFLQGAHGAQPAFVMSCEPPTRFFCVNASCHCGVSCGSSGVKSFTCNETTHVSSCVCN